MVRDCTQEKNIKYYSFTYINIFEISGISTISTNTRYKQKYGVLDPSVAIGSLFQEATLCSEPQQ